MNPYYYTTQGLLYLEIKKMVQWLLILLLEIENPLYEGLSHNPIGTIYVVKIEWPSPNLNPEIRFISQVSRCSARTSLRHITMPLHHDLLLMWLYRARKTNLIAESSGNDGSSESRLVEKRVEIEVLLFTFVVVSVVLSCPSLFPANKTSEGLYTRKCIMFWSTLRLVLHLQTVVI